MTEGHNNPASDEDLSESDIDPRYDPAEGRVLPIFIRYAVLSVLGMLAVSSAGIIDGFFIGNFVGATALAAVMILSLSGQFLPPLFTCWLWVDRLPAGATWAPKTRQQPAASLPEPFALPLAPAC